MADEELKLTKKEMQRNESLANDLKAYIKKHELGDTRIYFNGLCYDFNSNSKMTTIGVIFGSTYFEYANDKTVSMSFEGTLYNILNYGEAPKMLEEFDKIFAKHKCYYELGYAWSLSVYFDED